MVSINWPSALALLENQCWFECALYLEHYHCFCCRQMALSDEEAKLFHSTRLHWQNEYFYKQTRWFVCAVVHLWCLKQLVWVWIDAKVTLIELTTPMFCQVELTVCVRGGFERSGLGLNVPDFGVNTFIMIQNDILKYQKHPNKLTGWCSG